MMCVSAIDLDNLKLCKIKPYYSLIAMKVNTMMDVHKSMGVIACARHIEWWQRFTEHR